MRKFYSYNGEIKVYPDAINTRRNEALDLKRAKVFCIMDAEIKNLEYKAKQLSVNHDCIDTMGNRFQTYFNMNYLIWKAKNDQ